MTISTTTSKITYQGNGATTIFTFPFVGDQYTDLEVIYTNVQGASTTLNPSQYTVVINTPPTGGLWGIGGTITYPNTGSPPIPIASGTYLTIVRSVPYTQTVSINNQGAFYPQVVEQALDILELQIQQLETNSEYSLRAPLIDTSGLNDLPSSSTRSNGYLAFDNTGQPIVTTVITPIGPTSNATTRKVSVSGPSTITLTSSDSFGGVSIYQTGSGITTIQLPAAGGPYPIFDGSNNASTNNIKVLPPLGLTIQGASSFILAFNFQSVTFYNDGTQILVG